MKIPKKPKISINGQEIKIWAGTDYLSFDDNVFEIKKEQYQSNLL